MDIFDTSPPLWLTFLTCFTPSLLWLAYWWYRSRLGSRRFLTSLAMYGAGLLAGPLAYAIFTAFEATPFYEGLSTFEGIGDIDRFVYAIVAIGPTEEFSKFLMVWLALAVFRDRFDPLIGGPSYAISAALGFAAVECWFATLEYEELLLWPALLMPFTHVLFSCFWGVGITLDRALPHNGRQWLIASLALSFVFHGMYDYIYFSEDIPVVTIVPLLGALWVWCVLSIRKVHRMLGDLAPALDDEESVPANP